MATRQLYFGNINFDGNNFIGIPIAVGTPANGQALGYNSTRRTMEFVNAGPGPQGDPGDTGPTGGTVGTIGTMGTAGPTGPTGPTFWVRQASTISGRQSVRYNTANTTDTDNTVAGPQSLEGAATKMFFDPTDGAFRAGIVNGTQWDYTNLGTRSLAFGENNTVSGANSAAIGGSSHSIAQTSSDSFIGSGNTNLIANNGSNGIVAGSNNSITGGICAICAGNNNVINQNCDTSAIASGINNTLQNTLTDCFIGAGTSNSVNGGVTAITQSCVCGGSTNIATGSRAVVVGGSNNTASGLSSFVGAGSGNVASGQNSAVGGGTNNQATGVRSCVIGGSGNLASGTNSCVPGGASNVASGTNSLALGQSCTASGNQSIALGRNATAASTNTFVWSDGTTLTSGTTNPQTFWACAGGGIRFYSHQTNNTSGTEVLAGGSSWGGISSKKYKDNLLELDYDKILDSVVDDLGIYEYNFIGVPERICIGPTADDWHRCFPLGKSVESIETIDLDGVTLACIKSLGRTVRELTREIVVN